jgi:hypothetical protein
MVKFKELAMDKEQAKQPGDKSQAPAMVNVNPDNDHQRQ